MKENKKKSLKAYISAIDWLDMKIFSELATSTLFFDLNQQMVALSLPREKINSFKYILNLKILRNAK